MITRTFESIKEHPWLYLTALGGILFAYASVVSLFSESKAIIATVVEISDNRRKIESVKDFEAMIPRLEKDEKRLSLEMDRLVTGESKGTQVSRILSTLAETAKKTNLNLTSIQPLETRNQKRYIEIPVRLSVSGRYHALGQFIHSLESDRPVAHINTLEIVSENMSSNRIHAELSLTLFSPAALP